MAVSTKWLPANEVVMKSEMTIKAVESTGGPGALTVVASSPFLTMLK